MSRNEDDREMRERLAQFRLQRQRPDASKVVSASEKRVASVPEGHVVPTKRPASVVNDKENTSHPDRHHPPSHQTTVTEEQGEFIRRNRTLQLALLKHHLDQQHASLLQTIKTELDPKFDKIAQLLDRRAELLLQLQHHEQHTRHTRPFNGVFSERIKCAAEILARLTPLAERLTASMRDAAQRITLSCAESDVWQIRHELDGFHTHATEQTRHEVAITKLRDVLVSLSDVLADESALLSESEQLADILHNIHLLVSPASCNKPTPG